MRARVVWNLQRSMRTYYMKRRDLEEMQRAKLARLLKFAHEYAPYYRKKLGAGTAGFDPDSAALNLELLPTTTKEDFVSNYPGGFVVGGERPKAIRGGSGTSGSSALVPHSQSSLDVRHALFLRFLLLSGMRPWGRIVTMWIPEAYWRREPDGEGRMRPTTSLYGYPVWILGRPPPNVRVLKSLPGDPESEAKALHELRPSYLFGRPTQLRRVSRALTSMGLDVKTNGVYASAEMLTRNCQSELSSKFGARVHSAIGSSETGGWGCTCPAGAGFHLYEDYMVVEVLRGEERALPGEVGEVVVTHLHNFLCPLVRYRTGDYVRLSTREGCACGSSLPLIDAFEGRESDCLVDADGRRVWANELADHIESEFGLVDFQVVQTGRNEILLKLMKKDVDEVSLGRLKDYLDSVTGRTLKMSTVEREQDDIWRKYRPVVNTLDPRSLVGQYQSTRRV